MKRFASSLILAGFGLFSVLANETAFARAAADKCSTQDFISDATPLCPAQGALLPETFPAMSVSISDDTEGYAFVEQMVEKVFRAQSKPAPIVFLNVSKENFKRLQKHFAGLPWATAKMRENLRWVHSTGVTESHRVVDSTLNWQQDFYKGFFDPVSGRSVARMVPNYSDIGHLTETFPEDLKMCGIAVGEELPTRLPGLRGSKNGFGGGNLDMIPSGICVLGSADLSDVEWENYSKQVCGSAERVKAPTSWLESFHTDEIFKVVPTNDPAPCDFALLFASPRKAQQLLTEHADDRAFQYGAMSDSEFDQKQMRLTGMSVICTILEQDLYTRVYGYAHEESHVADALHGSGKIQRGAMASHLVGAMSVSGFLCPRIKNADVLRAVDLDSTTRELNQKIQVQMDGFKKEVLSKLKKTLPQCQIKAIDVPNLFVGALAILPNGEKVPAPGSELSGYSVYPNPANADVMGRTVLMSEPYNETIKHYLSFELQQLGLKTEFADTIHGFEVLGGLHCETQILRYCRPAPR